MNATNEFFDELRNKLLIGIKPDEKLPYKTTIEITNPEMSKEEVALIQMINQATDAAIEKFNIYDWHYLTDDFQKDFVLMFVQKYNTLRKQEDIFRIIMDAQYRYCEDNGLSECAEWQEEVSAKIKIGYYLPKGSSSSDTNKSSNETTIITEGRIKTLEEENASLKKINEELENKNREYCDIINLQKSKDEQFETTSKEVASLKNKLSRAEKVKEKAKEEIAELKKLFTYKKKIDAAVNFTSILECACDELNNDSEREKYVFVLEKVTRNKGLGDEVEDCIKEIKKQGAKPNMKIIIKKLNGTLTGPFTQYLESDNTKQLKDGKEDD